MFNRKLTLLIVTLVLALLIVPAALAQDDEPLVFREEAPTGDNLELVPVVTGFSNPLQVTDPNDGSGRLFVVEQSGRIYIVRDGELLDTPFIDLSDVASQDVLSRYSERGLLGLAFHPDFAENGLFYVNYTASTASHASRVTEFRVSDDNPDRADRANPRVVMTIGQPYANHNGGHIAFGPDGYLYISVGDGGGSDDPVNAGQDRSTLLGTILRIDVDDTDNGAYGIPADNPVFTDGTFAPEVWAWGLRNVWRFSFDQATGDLYLADVGQNAWEEINFQPADAEGGLNYGWPAYEGSNRYIGPEPETDVVMPIAEYDHSQGCSVTGGYVYRGDLVPDLDGVYLFSDWCSGRLWGTYRDLNGDWQTDLLMETGISISSFGQDADGEVYIVDYAGGRVLRLESSG